MAKKKVVKTLQDLAEIKTSENTQLENDSVMPSSSDIKNTKVVDLEDHIIDESHSIKQIGENEAGPTYDSASREEIESIIDGLEIASSDDMDTVVGQILEDLENIHPAYQLEILDEVTTTILQSEEKSGQVIIDVSATETTSTDVYIPGEPEPMKREVILEELKSLYSLLRTPYVSQSWDSMDTSLLYDLLTIVRKDAGGSLEVASLIQQTKEDFEVSISSEMMKSRLKIADQKAADYAKIVQRMSAMLGSDVVINGARTKEYHEMVREYVKYIVTLTQKINSLAQFFNITIPVEEEFPNGPHIPVVNEMPCSPMNAIYILNVVMATMDRTVTSSKFAKESLERANNRIEYLESQLRVARERIDDLQRSATKAAEETQRLIGNSSYWIIKDQHGRILQKIDPDKPLETPADLDLHGTIDTALFITTARSAEILVERLSRSRRFRKYNLNSYRVSIVQQTFNERPKEEAEEEL